MEAAPQEPLALEGGRPVRTTLLPYGSHRIGAGDEEAVAAALLSGRITQGSRVDQFENDLAEFCGAAQAVAFSSGTSALHAACLAAGLGPGTEAVTTPLTFVATANAPLYCGASVRFGDIRPDTLNLSPESLEERITPATRAVLPVDFAGQPADLDRILEIARRHQLTVIEDASHAFGARCQGRQVGSISHMTVFSFHPIKPLTTAEGGAVLTDDIRFAQRLRRLRHHEIHHPDPDSPWRYEVVGLGYNYRMSDLHAALGISQLRNVFKRGARRNEIAARYRNRLAGTPGITLPALLPGAEHAWHLFIVLLDLERLTADRDTIIRALRAEGIGAALHYPLVHLQPFYRRRLGTGEGLCPAAEAAAPRLLTLPLFDSMTDQDAEDVLTAVTKVLVRFRRGSAQAGTHAS